MTENNILSKSDKKYKVKNIKKMTNEELKEFLDWFLNLNKFSEKAYLSCPEKLKKYFEECEK
ncbi:MAG: hypothetical protein NZZ41_00365 [Candidatus Dojkabacteria bacterium]|nr:hypothetical protein [Candidatus Dojkabacteria bacterium]